MLGALDIGGTKIAAGMVDANGRVAARAECSTESERGFDDGLRRMTAMLREAERAAGECITGIGIGSTGPVDPFTGYVLPGADTIPGWIGSDLAGSLARAFGVSVGLENDADAAALGEAAWGAGRGKKNFIYVTISTGIGVGVIAGGRLYRGVDGYHPEIGHHFIDASGPPCYCGGSGCWESLASGPAMVQWMRSQKPNLPPDLSAERIFAMAAGGDALAARAVEREGRYVGLGLANLVTMYCPEAIALGGGVMRSGAMFLERAKQVVRESCRLVPHEKTEIVYASLGASTGLAGAARVWTHRFGAAAEAR